MIKVEELPIDSINDNEKTCQYIECGKQTIEESIQAMYDKKLLFKAWFCSEHFTIYTRYPDKLVSDVTIGKIRGVDRNTFINIK